MMSPAPPAPLAACSAPRAAARRRCRRPPHQGRCRFSGRTRDGRYSWVRYYQPTLQRFISEDPIGFAGGDVNLYAYVANNPATFIDPIGLDRDCCPDGRPRDALNCYSRCVYTLVINPAGYLANLLVFGSASSIGASRLPSGQRVFVAAGRAVGRAFGNQLRGAVEGLRLKQVTITAASRPVATDREGWR